MSGKQFAKISSTLKSVGIDTMGWISSVKTTASWSSASWIPHLYNSFSGIFRYSKDGMGSSAIEFFAECKLQYKYTIIHVPAQIYNKKHPNCSMQMNSCLMYSLRLLFCTYITHSVSVFDVLSQFAMLYMLLSLSLGWTLGTSYRFAHLQMVSRKPAAKVVGTLGILQVCGKSIHNQKN